MRRAVPSFTVEVRRRPRLATKSNPGAQSSENKSPQGAFDRESHRAAAAAFEEKEVDEFPVDVVASHPMRRILPSLIADEPSRRPLRDSALATAESEPPSRAPKWRDAPLAERLSTAPRQTSSVEPNEGAHASPKDPTTAQSQVVGDSGGLVLGPKARRRDKLAISCDDHRAKPLPNDQRSALATDSLATHLSQADDRPPQSRKRTILARYVFGDEHKLKPGERWKRRLLTTR